MPAWPRAPWTVAAFLGGLSFTGFYFLPSWLLRPLFFLTPVAGPFLLLVTGVLALWRARRLRGDATRKLGWPALLVAAVTFVLVAVIDLLLYLFIPYIGPLVVLVAFPVHYLCVVTYAMGALASLQTDAGSRALRLALAPVAGLLAGIALVFVRFAIVPQSSGVFLKVFSASGAEIHPSQAPLDRHGQRDLATTLGVYPRSLHESIAALGDDGLWTARRSTGSDCSGYWIQRRGLRVDAPGWGRCLPSEPGMVRNPTGMAVDPSGGLLVVGFDVHGGLESWWMKAFDDQGREDDRRSKVFPVETRIDRPNGALVDRDGSAYVFGESGGIDRSGTHGWVRKFDRDGRELLDGWNKRFPNAGDRRPTMAAVSGAVDAEGNLYVLLYLHGAPSIWKFDGNGRELPGWPRELPGSRDLTLAVDPAGALLVAGITGYPDQGWLAKFEPDGTPAWEKKLALGHLTAANALGIDRTRSIYAVGSRTGPESPSSGWWIKKFNPDGRELPEWDKTLGATGLNGIPFIAHVSADDQLYVLGTGSGWRFSGSWLERWWGWE